MEGKQNNSNKRNTTLFLWKNILNNKYTRIYKIQYSRSFIEAYNALTCLVLSFCCSISTPLE